jgi:hypothetical protein
MHHAMWAKARWEFAAELRLRTAKFGATPEDRMRLRLTVQTPGEQPKEQPTGPLTRLRGAGTCNSPAKRTVLRVRTRGISGQTAPSHRFLRVGVDRRSAGLRCHNRAGLVVAKSAVQHRIKVCMA